jgi:hypothetical protein
MLPLLLAEPGRRSNVVIDTFDVTPATSDETDAFLTNDTDEDVQRSDDLWNSHTSTPGLPDAHTVNKKVLLLNRRAQRKAYIYDYGTGRYRFAESGRLVPERQVRNDVIRIGNFSRNEMRELTAKLNRHEITLQRWYDTMRKMMKDSYRAAWIASIGGKENYDKRQQALFGRAVKSQYVWLDNFLNQVKSGKQQLNGRAMIRAGMYGEATNAIFQNALLDRAKTNGMNYCVRVRTAIESCPTCVTQAARGIVPINEAVRIGDSECRSNCKCYFIFGKSSD